MQISDIFLGLGEDRFQQLLRSVSIGKLKTFQLYERLKVRFHLQKLNSESLRKATPKFWIRFQEHDEEFATELAQAILVSQMEMIKAVLDVLAVPHEDGFFAKDLEPAQYLTEGWQQRVLDHFRGKFPEPLLLFYINHLALEVNKADEVFAPAAQLAPAAQ